MESDPPAVIAFCETCHLRKGAVSSTHSRCSVDEASCQCEDAEQKEPESQESDTNRRSPYNSENEDEPQKPIEAAQPRTVEKLAPGEGRIRVLSPAREAAIAVRRWAVKFAEIGLDFPSCMANIAHLNPHQVLKRLKLDDCASRDAAVDWKISGHANMKEGAVKNCAAKALVKYKNAVPPCFNPFSVSEYAPNLGDTTKMSNPEIWWLMDKGQRMQLLLDEAKALQERKAVMIRMGAEGDWYARCLSIVRGGCDAMRNHLRHGMKRRKISHECYEQTNSMSKAEIDSKTIKAVGVINLTDLKSDSDHDSDF